MTDASFGSTERSDAWYRDCGHVMSGLYAKFECLTSIKRDDIIQKEDFSNGLECAVDFFTVKDEKLDPDLIRKLISEDKKSHIWMGSKSFNVVSRTVKWKVSPDEFQQRWNRIPTLSHSQRVNGCSDHDRLSKIREQHGANKKVS